MIFETSWEVCNKVGGIYTVLSTRAKQMMQAHQGAVCFVGPLFEGEVPKDFDPSDAPDFLKSWQAEAADAINLPIAVGRWRCPGAPPVVLVDYTSLYAIHSKLLFELWEAYGLESDNAGNEYDRSALFAIAAAKVIISLHQSRGSQPTDVAIYNEWMLGAGLLYQKLYAANLPALFITHATSVGRSIAANGKELYDFLPNYDGDQMAAELGVVSKHRIEKKVAMEATVFATVSEVAADEAEQLIGRRPIVLPNGFEPDFVPEGNAYDEKRQEARLCLLSIASTLTSRTLPADSLLVSVGGRSEYRNKGLDVFLDALALVRDSYIGDRPLVAFIFVPAWVSHARADLMRVLNEPKAEDQAPLQHPYITHWLHNMEGDAVVSRIHQLGFQHLTSKNIFLINVPSYLDGHDGIFDRSYYDLLIGTDLNVYPSYYEPWGYTPMESIAFGIPAITSDLSGYGRWMASSPDYDMDNGPLYVVPRHKRPYGEIVDHTAKIMLDRLKHPLSSQEAYKERLQAFSLTKNVSWKALYRYYLENYPTAQG